MKNTIIFTERISVYMALANYHTAKDLIWKKSLIEIAGKED